MVKPNSQQNNSDDTMDLSRVALTNMGIDPDDGDTGDDADDADDVADEAAKLPADDRDPRIDQLHIDLGDREPPKKKGITKTLPDDQQQRQQPDQQPAPAPNVAPVHYSVDQKGNVIDRKTGQILAPSGPAARFFKELQASRVSISRVQRDLDGRSEQLRTAIQVGRSINDKLKAFKEGSEIFGKVGLTSTEAMEAANLYASFKKGGADGLAALKQILTRAAAGGIDVASLGVGAGAFDPKTLVETLRAELSPLTKSITDRQAEETKTREQQEADQALWDDTTNTVLDFFEHTPEAVPHAQAINTLINDPRMKGYSLREVWLTYQLYLRDKQSNEGNNRKANGGRAPTTPPSGHGRLPNGNNRDDDFSRPAPVGMSQEQIINEVLDRFAEEAGWSD